MTASPSALAMAREVAKQIEADHQFGRMEPKRIEDRAILIATALTQHARKLAAEMVRETGAVEALELANQRATAHRLDDYYATGGTTDNDYEAQLKTSAALANLKRLT